MPIRPRDHDDVERIDAVLTEFHTNARRLPGIQAQARRRAFLDQLFDSIHRIQFIEQGVLCRRGEPRDLDPNRANPASDMFDPIRAAAIRASQGEHDEACWFVFLFAHFGKNLRTGYRLARDVYGGLGKGLVWDWASTSANPEAFRRWLAANLDTLRNDGTPRYFGNHRKYESLGSNDHGSRGTADAFATYVGWVTAHRNHNGRFDHAAAESDHDRRRTFHHLYRSMREVASFGRTARFDYLTMLAKLGLADIEPGSTYMTGATGPLAGAKLLFGKAADRVKPREIDRWLVELEAKLGLTMGMQVLEDALCNWQKNPTCYVPFRG
jgi:hypothetical protein